MPPETVVVRNLGLVLCNPFGKEAISAHRSLRHFAEAAAAIGVPALRFDYDGTGNSAGDDRDPERWEAWRASVHSALDEIRRSCGVDRVCLLGIRTGATLATLASSEREDVAGLIALAPIISGKAWLRELRAMQIAIGLAGSSDIAPAQNDEESIGFPITPETRAAVQEVDLLRLQQRPAADVLVIDRAELAHHTRWVDHLRALGANVEHQFRDGYVEMMLDPHDSVVPDEMVRAATAWLERLPGRDAINQVGTSPGVSLNCARVGGGVEETATFFDAEGTLFGIVSAPPEKSRSTKAIVLLNAGAVPHTGPNRLYVRMARRWAARGYVVLRFDLSGLGDSLSRPGEAENVVYSPFAIKDIALALQYLREHWGVTSIQVAGLCSGAYHAFKAAVARLPLSTAVIINPLVFFWKPGTSLAYPSAQVLEAMARYEESALHLAKWKKFLQGKVNIIAFTHVVVRSLGVILGARARDLARRAGYPLAHDLGTELIRAARNGVALRFIFSAGDPGEELLKVQGGSTLRRLLNEAKISVRRVDGANHTFTHVWSHDVLLSVMEEELSIRMRQRPLRRPERRSAVLNSLPLSLDRRRHAAGH